jgi:hypothetical protein
MKNTTRSCWMHRLPTKTCNPLGCPSNTSVHPLTRFSSAMPYLALGRNLEISQFLWGVRNGERGGGGGWFIAMRVANAKKRGGHHWSSFVGPLPSFAHHTHTACCCCFSAVNERDSRLAGYKGFRLVKWDSGLKHDDG